MCASSSRFTLERKAQREQELVGTALQWVAFAYQPLHAEQLWKALIITFTLSFDLQKRKDIEENFWSCEEVLYLCADYVGVSNNGMVEFHDEHVRDSVLSQDFPPPTRSSPYSGHEMLAMACLCYLESRSPQTVLQHWSNKHQRNGAESHPGHLHDYVAAFWQSHARMAEGNSRYVSAMIHRTILQALSKSNEGDRLYAPKSREKTNIGLLICSKFDFPNLGKTYLEMGAERNHQTSWHDSPLNVAIANSCQRMVQLLLDRHEVPDVLDQNVSSSSKLACSASQVQVGCVPVERGAEFKPQGRCHVTLGGGCWGGHGYHMTHPDHDKQSRACKVHLNPERKLERNDRKSELLEGSVVSVTSAKSRRSYPVNQRFDGRDLPLRTIKNVVHDPRGGESTRDSKVSSRRGSYGITKITTKPGSPGRSRPFYRSRSGHWERAQARYIEQEDWLIVDKRELDMVP